MNSELQLSTLNQIDALAADLNISLSCGCWVVADGEYWQGRRKCDIECTCECHEQPAELVRLLDAVPVLTAALREFLLPLQAGGKAVL